MQKRDIIYIDVEDDITAIIGKIKESKEKIIALVPPKRIGVLQSAVNLRLLARTADHAKKRLVIITANSALSSLAASASIPVAKTLQSKPGLAEVPALSVDDEEVIDGKSEVGDFPVEKKPIRQWVLKITDYAERLLEDLEDLDCPETTADAFVELGLTVRPPPCPAAEHPLPCS